MSLFGPEELDAAIEAHELGERFRSAPDGLALACMRGLGRRGSRRLRRGGGADFTPEDHPTLELWARLDTVLLSGSSITQATDKSASGHDLTQGTAAAQPTQVTEDGQLAASHDGGDRLAVAFGHSHPQPITTYGVVKLADLLGNYYLFDGNAAGARCAVSITSAGPTWVINGGSAQSGGTPVEDQILFVCATYNGASSYLWVGDIRDGQSVIGPVNAGSHSPTGFTLGSRYDGAGGLVGFTYEAIVSSGADDQALRTKVARYAKRRYPALQITF